MRIATSTIYTQQAMSIDNLETQVQAQGQDLSTGKSLNAPSDDPSQIGADLEVRTTIKVQNQQATNVQAATAELTATDSQLASLTSILQSVRQLAVSSATTLTSPTSRQAIASQVDQYLQQAVGIANTQYGGTYIFGGSVQSSNPPVTTAGSPISSVSYTGNDQAQTPLLYGGQNIPVSPSLQQAFNFGATNGSPSVFQTLINLRDSLTGGLVTDQSAHSINQAGQVIYGAASPAPTTLVAPVTVPPTVTPFAVAPTADSSGNFTISINNADATGTNHVESYTFSGTAAVDDGSAASITGAINANSAVTGLTASFDAQTQRLILTNAGGGAFNVTDAPSPGASNTSNFTKMFALTGSATLPQTISTQLGDIDNALNVTLDARGVVGSRMNALSLISTQISTDVMDNTAVQSGIEDTDIATATTKFSATQAALTASYSTTTRMEQKDLFDYL